MAYYRSVWDAPQQYSYSGARTPSPYTPVDSYPLLNQVTPSFDELLQMVLNGKLDRMPIMSNLTPETVNPNDDAIFRIGNTDISMADLTDAFVGGAWGYGLGALGGELLGAGAGAAEAGAGAAETGLSAELAAGAPELAGTMGLDAGVAGAGGLTGMEQLAQAPTGIMTDVGGGLSGQEFGSMGDMFGSGAAYDAGTAGLGETAGLGTTAAATTGLQGGDGGAMDMTGSINSPTGAGAGGTVFDAMPAMGGFDWGSIPENIRTQLQQALAPQGGMNWLGLGSDLINYAGQRGYQQDLLNTMNRAIDYSDPAFAQRGQYQQQFNQMNTDPDWMSKDKVLQGMQDVSMRNISGRNEAKGYLNSGNILHDLMRTGVETAGNYAMPRMQQVGEAGGLLGGRQNASQAIGSLGQAAGQAGLGQNQLLGQMIGRIPTNTGGIGSAINSGISSGVNTAVSGIGNWLGGLFAS